MDNALKILTAVSIVTIVSVSAATAQDNSAEIGLTLQAGFGLYSEQQLSPGSPLIGAVQFSKRTPFVEWTVVGGRMLFYGVAVQFGAETGFNWSPGGGQGYIGGVAAWLGSFREGLPTLGVRIGTRNPEGSGLRLEARSDIAFGEYDRDLYLIYLTIGYDKTWQRRAR